jgi:hypothetical protein
MKLLKMESSVSLAEVLDKLDLLEGRKFGCSESSDVSKSKTSSTKSHTTAEKKQAMDKDKRTEPSSSPLGEENPLIKTEALNLEDVRNRWNEVLGKIKKTKLSLWSLLKDGQIMGLADDTLTVEFHNGSNFHKKQAEKKENFNLIQNALGEVFDQPFRLEFQLNKAKISSSADTDNSKSADAQNEVKKDPLVKSIMDTFEGEII